VKSFRKLGIEEAAGSFGAVRLNTVILRSEGIFS
jgi:hypothetical protein